MPVIVAKQNYSHWLDKKESLESRQEILKTDGYENMTLNPVSDWVNIPQHDDINCLSLSLQLLSNYLTRLPFPLLYSARFS
jgi:putative SOS response-associated peptidase YedK